MSVVATCLLLGILVVFLIKTRQVKFTAAAACAVFGLVLGMTPAASTVNEALNASGSWLWLQVRSV